MSEFERMCRFFRCEWPDCKHEWIPKQKDRTPPSTCPKCRREGWWDGKYEKPGPRKWKAKTVKQRPMTGSEVLQWLKDHPETG